MITPQQFRDFSRGLKRLLKVFCPEATWTNEEAWKGHTEAPYQDLTDNE